MKIAWFAGHDNIQGGADSIWLRQANLKSREYDLNKEIVRIGCEYLKNKLGANIQLLEFNGENINRKSAGAILNEKINIINQWGADLAIESHFNSAGSEKATGCEVLYFSLPGFVRFSRRGKILANLIQSNLINILNNNPDRVTKIKDRGHIGAEGMSEIIRSEGPARLAFLMKTKMPSVIIEPFFLSNKGDVECLLKGGAIAQRELENIAVGTANGIIQFIQGGF